MKIIVKATEGCGKLSSNETLFSNSWFSGVKKTGGVMDEGVYYCGLAKTSQKLFCLDTLEKSTKEWPGGSHLVMKSTSRVTGDRPLMAIIYKYIDKKILGYIDMEGARSTIPGVTYLSCYPCDYSNVSILPVISNHLLGRYFSDCIEIENHNRMWQSDIVLEKNSVTQSGYFRLVTTVALVMEITYANLLFCHGIQSK